LRRSVERRQCSARIRGVRHLLLLLLQGERATLNRLILQRPGRERISQLDLFRLHVQRVEKRDRRSIREIVNACVGWHDFFSS
jgi:hypothetical protein